MAKKPDQIGDMLKNLKDNHTATDAAAVAMSELLSGADNKAATIKQFIEEQKTPEMEAAEEGDVLIGETPAQAKTATNPLDIFTPILDKLSGTVKPEQLNDLMSKFTGKGIDALKEAQEKLTEKVNAKVEQVKVPDGYPVPPPSVDEVLNATRATGTQDTSMNLGGLKRPRIFSQRTTDIGVVSTPEDVYFDRCTVHVDSVHAKKLRFKNCTVVGPINVHHRDASVKMDKTRLEKLYELPTNDARVQQFAEHLKTVFPQYDFDQIVGWINAMSDWVDANVIVIPSQITSCRAIAYEYNRSGDVKVPLDLQQRIVQFLLADCTPYRDHVHVDMVAIDGEFERVLVGCLLDGTKVKDALRAESEVKKQSKKGGIDLGGLAGMFGAMGGMGGMGGMPVAPPAPMANVPPEVRDFVFSELAPIDVTEPHPLLTRDDVAKAYRTFTLRHSLDNRLATDELIGDIVEMLDVEHPFPEASVDPNSGDFNGLKLKDWTDEEVVRDFMYNYVVADPNATIDLDEIVEAVDQSRGLWRRHDDIALNTIETVVDQMLTQEKFLGDVVHEFDHNDEMMQTHVHYRGCRLKTVADTPAAVEEPAEPEPDDCDHKDQRPVADETRRFYNSAIVYRPANVLPMVVLYRAYATKFCQDRVIEPLNPGDLVYDISRIAGEMGLDVGIDDHHGLVNLDLDPDYFPQTPKTETADDKGPTFDGAEVPTDDPFRAVNDFFKTHLKLDPSGEFAVMDLFDDYVAAGGKDASENKFGVLLRKFVITLQRQGADVVPCYVLNRDAVRRRGYRGLKLLEQKPLASSTEPYDIMKDDVPVPDDFNSFTEDDELDDWVYGFLTNACWPSRGSCVTLTALTRSFKKWMGLPEDFDYSDAKIRKSFRQWINDYDMFRDPEEFPKLVGDDVPRERRCEVRIEAKYGGHQNVVVNLATFDSKILSPLEKGLDDPTVKPYDNITHDLDVREFLNRACVPLCYAATPAKDLHNAFVEAVGYSVDRTEFLESMDSALDEQGRYCWVAFHNDGPEDFYSGLIPKPDVEFFPPFDAVRRPMSVYEYVARFVKFFYMPDDSAPRKSYTKSGSHMYAVFQDYSGLRIDEDTFLTMAVRAVRAFTTAGMPSPDATPTEWADVCFTDYTVDNDIEYPQTFVNLVSRDPVLEEQILEEHGD